MSQFEEDLENNIDQECEYCGELMIDCICNQESFND